MCFTGSHLKIERYGYFYFPEAKYCATEMQSQSIIVLSKILGIHRISRNKGVDIYISLIILLHTAMMVYSIINFRKFAANRMFSDLTFLLDYLVHAMSSLNCVLGILYATLLNKDNFINLHEKLQKLSKSLNVTNFVTVPQCFVVHIYVIIMTIIQFLFISYKDQLQLSLIDSFQFYSVILMNMQHQFILETLLISCRELKEKIRNIGLRFLALESTISLNKEIKKIQNWYEAILNIVTLISKVYGAQFLCFFTFIVIYSTRTLQTSMAFGILMTNKNAYFLFPILHFNVSHSIIYWVCIKIENHMFKV